MSELTVYKFLGIDEIYPDANLGSDYYLKYEADKVIDDLYSRNAQLRKDKANLLRNNENLKLEIKTQKLGRLNDKIQYQITERHHKYKRCLDMAYKCVVLCQKSKDLYRWAEDENLEHHYNHKIEFFARWHKRWLKLAEKFKEAK